MSALGLTATVDLDDCLDDDGRGAGDDGWRLEREPRPLVVDSCESVIYDGDVSGCFYVGEGIDEWWDMCLSVVMLECGRLISSPDPTTSPCGLSKK